jgi:hypothetical protein
VHSPSSLFVLHISPYSCLYVRFNVFKSVIVNLYNCVHLFVNITETELLTNARNGKCKIFNSFY